MELHVKFNPSDEYQKNWLREKETKKVAMTTGVVDLMKHVHVEWSHVFNQRKFLLLSEGFEAFNPAG